MLESANLHDLLQHSRESFAEHPALEDPGRGTLSYRQLGELVDQLAEQLRSVGMRAGDRLGLCLPKSLASVTGLFAALKLGGAYVPVDSEAPAARNCYIFKDCRVRALVIERAKVEALLQEWGEDGSVEVHELDLFRPFELDLCLLVCSSDAAPADEVPGLAYILYTSGSTGKPKGVMHTHASAFGFIDWCTQEFSLSAQDRFSSHAPLHFDLSIFDLFVSIKSGATLVLIGEAAGKQPMALAELVSERRISVWYSTPSILRLLVEFGRLGERDYSALRIVLFAGETYPLNQYRQLQEHWDTPVYYNLYGPTETNVCTFYRLPPRIEDGAYDYFPIGLACSGDELLITSPEGSEVRRGSPASCWCAAARSWSATGTCRNGTGRPSSRSVGIAGIGRGI